MCIGCFSVWCFPCFACITARDHGECLCLPLLDSCGLIPPVTLSMRVSMRRRYGIKVRTKTIFLFSQCYKLYLKPANLWTCLRCFIYSTLLDRLYILIRTGYYFTIGSSFIVLSNLVSLKCLHRLQSLSEPAQIRSPLSLKIRTPFATTVCTPSSAAHAAGAKSGARWRSGFILSHCWTTGQQAKGPNHHHHHRLSSSTQTSLPSSA